MMTVLKYGIWFIVQLICSAFLIVSSVWVEHLFGKQYKVLNVALYFLLLLSGCALVLVWRASRHESSLRLIREASIFPITTLAIFVLSILPMPGTSGFVSTLSETMVGFVIIAQAEALWKVHCDLAAVPAEKSRKKYRDMKRRIG